MRRALASLTLLAYVATAVALPVPTAADAPKDRGQPFPCQEHACGCRDADACWRHCCCFTPEEKLAWAHAHGVQPPAFAQPVAAQSWHTTRLRDQAEGQAPTCACSQPTPTERSCCQPTDPANDRGHKSWPGVRWKLGMTARQCQGLSLLWVSGGAVVPPVAPSDWQVSLVPAGWMCFANATALFLTPLPPDPPPRSACA